jgi:hypothetical protein
MSTPTCSSGPWIGQPQVCGVPSQIVSNRTTTRDVAMCILTLEFERGYTRPVEELPLGADASCCWEEGMVGADFTNQTEMASDDMVHHTLASLR